MKPLHARSLALVLVLLCAAAGCGGTDEAIAGGACGGRGGDACPGDQYCDFGKNRCGSDDVPGVCTPRPTSCPVLLVPERTCGCDGVVHSSACDANLAGADVNAAGTCPLDTGVFACGYRQCNRSTQYCTRSVSDVGSEPDAFTCIGLPAGCGGTASCACVAGQPCGTQCGGDAASGVTLTCPGG